LALHPKPFWLVEIRRGLVELRSTEDVFRYDVGMRFWFTSLGWGTAALALIGIARMPQSNLELYFYDYYVIVSRLALRVSVLVGLFMPLATVTVWRLRRY
jgi:cytochrome b subunit of formate dehydrogenase